MEQININKLYRLEYPYLIAQLCVLNNKPYEEIKVVVDALLAKGKFAIQDESTIEKSNSAYISEGVTVSTTIESKPKSNKKSAYSPKRKKSKKNKLKNPNTNSNKKKIDDLIDEIKKDGNLATQFEKEPVKVIEKIVGKDLPDDAVNKIIGGVKAKISLDKIFLSFS